MIEDINHLVLFFIVDIACVGLLIGLGRLLFRRGLGFRVFALVMPTVGLVGYAGIVIGVWHSSLSVFIVCAMVTVSITATSLILFNRMIIKQYKTQIDMLMASVSQLAATAQQTSSVAAEQAEAVSQVTATIEELDKMSDTAANSANEVLKSAAEAAEKGREGNAKVDKASRIMQTIGQVREIVETVNELSEQSNLLAVNAGIEAAKAGKFGRGFSVVASEVRNLAEQSKVATSEIQEAISRTDEGIGIIDSVQRVIRDLAKVQETASDNARQIFGISNQQSGGIRHITEAMASVSAGVTLTASATEELDQAVSSLNELGNGFRIFITGEARSKKTTV
jgi:methyl-accepting chemotaxis protein